MKKIILSALAVCAFTFSNAQETETTTETAGFAKGDMFISGQVGFGSDSTGDSKDNSFTLAPRVAYFVSENIAVGVKLGYTSTKSEDLGMDDVKTNMLEVGAMARYYFTPAAKFSLFGELGANFNTNKWEQGAAESDSAGFGVNVGPGINYFVSNNFAIEAGWGALGYNTNDNGGNGAESTDSFGLNVNMEAITFGLVYKF